MIDAIEKPLLDKHHEYAENIGFLIRKFYQKNQAVWQEFCPDPQTTSVQTAALAALLRNGESSLTEIGTAAAMDPATTRGVIDRLKQRGMISLKSDSSDKRKVIVKLEQAGYNFLKAMEPVIPAIVDATVTPLNPAEKVALHYLLRKVTEL